MKYIILVLLAGLIFSCKPAVKGKFTSKTITGKDGQEWLQVTTPNGSISTYKVITNKK